MTRHCDKCGGFVYGELSPNDVLCRCVKFVDTPEPAEPLVPWLLTQDDCHWLWQIIIKPE